MIFLFLRRRRRPVTDGLRLVASKSLDTLSGLVDDTNVMTVKVAIQCLTSVYPMLFRMLYAPISLSTVPLLMFIGPILNDRS